jgi:hypothetical protein
VSAEHTRTPHNLDEATSFMSVRVADVHACYEACRQRGAEVVTAPKDRGTEIRRYMRNPDGYVIEVGQTLTR